MEWAKTYGSDLRDAFNDLVQTPDGGYIVVGKVGKNNFDAPGVYNGGESDAWIVKLDSKGQIVWQKIYGSSLDDDLFEIISTSDGGYVAGGNQVPFNPTNADIWLLKFDGSGNKIWEKFFGAQQNEFLNSLKQSSDNGILVAARSDSPEIIGPPTSVLDVNAWVFKLDLSGNMVAQKTFGGSGHDEASAVLDVGQGEYFFRQQFQ